MRTLLLGCMLLGMLASRAVGAASTFEEFLEERQAQSEAFSDKLGQALEAVFDGRAVDALPFLAEARSIVESTLTLINQVEDDTLISEAQAERFRSAQFKGLLKVDESIELLASQGATKAAQIAALSSAGKAEAKANLTVQRSSKEIIRLAFGSPGFGSLKPGKHVCLAIKGIPASLKDVSHVDCPYTADASNPAELDGIRPIESLDPINPCSGQICFTMGTDMGTGAIVLSGPGGSSALQVITNPGSKESGGASLTGVAQYAGCYAGGFSGTVRIDEDCGGGTSPVSGPVALCVDEGGAITVSAPGSGKGRASKDGKGATGAVDAQLPARFGGAFINNRDNTSSTISGGWSARGECVAASGGWSAHR